MPIITLTTDFGLADPYVGLMKGVILSIAPGVTLIDLTHGLPPQNILAGALALESIVNYFPEHTIHLAVVDPGVGSTRAAVAIQTPGQFFVGPDNGLFTFAILKAMGNGPCTGVQLENSRYFRHPVSSTFHGRDIFAPVAAHLARGVPLAEFGPPTTRFTFLPISTPVRRGEQVEVHVLHIDRFGNAITDFIPPDLAKYFPATLAPQIRIAVNQHKISGIHSTFADVPQGQPVAYFGSASRLEIAVRNGDASTTLGIRTGDSFLLSTA